MFYLKNKIHICLNVIVLSNIYISQKNTVKYELQLSRLMYFHDKSPMSPRVGLLQAVCEIRRMLRGKPASEEPDTPSPSFFRSERRRPVGSLDLRQSLLSTGHIDPWGLSAVAMERRMSWEGAHRNAAVTSSKTSSERERQRNIRDQADGVSS